MSQRWIGGISGVKLAAERDDALGHGQPLQGSKLPPRLPLPLGHGRKIGCF